MKRRDLLKNIGLGTAGVAFTGTQIEAKENLPAIPKEDETPKTDAEDGWQRKEIDRNEKLMSETFFNKHEMATIAVLSDIIIPKDEVSGCATDADVPAFIEFIVKDMPQHQTPMRGGLMWLDLESKSLFEGKKFIETSPQNQLKLVDLIAYPNDAKPEYSQGVMFFTLMRNLTSTGFYTSEIGIKDIGYMGNTPNLWDGVPDSVLKKHGLSYDDWQKHVDK